jgi:hypothetical protein
VSAGRTAWQITLHVNVWDREALYTAAKARALADGYRVRDLRETIGTKRRPDVSACLVMLLDPGTSPAGCSIEDSTATGGDSLD